MSTLVQKDIKTSKHRKFHVNMEYYTSAQDVVRDCRERAITSSRFKDKSKESFDDWEGVRTYDEALDLLKNGYQPTVDALQDTVKANRIGTSKRISFQNEIAGFMPVVPLALKGVPNCMINMTMKPIKAKVIDVYYDMTANAGTSSQTIIENGQKLLACIIDLEKQGYKFNLYAVQTYCDDEGCDTLVVKIKSSDKPLDLKRMSFPLTHTAFFRVIGFDWYSRTPHGTFRGGYGHALKYEMSSEEERKQFAEQVFGKNAVMILGRQIQDTGEEHIKEVLTNERKNG